LKPVFSVCLAEHSKDLYILHRVEIAFKL
jgi:hypothetical protein